jgi:hypothetical protein
MAIASMAAVANAADVELVATGNTLQPTRGDVTGSCIEGLAAVFESFEASWIQSNDIPDTRTDPTVGVYPDPGDLGVPRLVATLQPGNIQISCPFAFAQVINNSPTNLDDDAYSMQGSDCTCGDHAINFALIFMRDSTGTALESDEQPDPFPTDAVFDMSYHFRIEGCDGCGTSSFFDARFPIAVLKVPEPGTVPLGLASLMIIGA